MLFKNLCVLVHWAKVALALEELIHILSGHSPGNLAQKWAFQKTNCNRIFFATMHFSEVPRPTY